MIKSRDRVDVVLDVVMDEGNYRVFLVGVFEEGERIPPMTEGAIARNHAQSFLNMHHDLPVLRMEAPS